MSKRPEIAPLISTGVSRILKVEWLAAFIQAHARVFNSDNLTGGFRGAGIFPLDPTKVLGRAAPRSPTLEPETRETTPPVDDTFNSTVLTSSPNDQNAV